MVIVTTHEYDGGDNYLTQTTQHVDASITRVTQLTTDWRGRRTAIDAILNDDTATITLAGVNVTQAEGTGGITAFTFSVT